MRQIYATRIRCDACGAEAEVKLTSAAQPPPDPDGWTHTLLQSPSASSHASILPVDLCPECSNKPFVAVIGLLDGRSAILNS
jgi:hypothetical protein